MQVGSKSYGQFLGDGQRFWGIKFIEILFLFITLVELRIASFQDNEIIVHSCIHLVIDSYHLHLFILITRNEKQKFRT
jgi:hypothetical protein